MLKNCAEEFELHASNGLLEPENLEAIPLDAWSSKAASPYVQNLKLSSGPSCLLTCLPSQHRLYRPGSRREPRACSRLEDLKLCL